MEDRHGGAGAGVWGLGSGGEWKIGTEEQGLGFRDWGLGGEWKIGTEEQGLGSGGNRR
jgi:hypothetical protein